MTTAPPYRRNLRGHAAIELKRIFDAFWRTVAVLQTRHAGNSAVGTPRPSDPRSVGSSRHRYA